MLILEYQVNVEGRKMGRVSGGAEFLWIFLRTRPKTCHFYYLRRIELVGFLVGNLSKCYRCTNIVMEHNHIVLQAHVAGVVFLHAWLSSMRCLFASG
jgi:hypothetical protein